MKTKYLSLNDLIEMIDQPNRNICKKLLKDNKKLFTNARGSRHKHQAWPGGYLDHITETMNIAILIFNPLNKFRKLPFTLSDALLILFLHDLEKPWKHKKHKSGNWENRQDLDDKKNQIWPFVKNKVVEYDFILTKNHWNALQYVEGEKDEANPKKRIQLPLAAFVNMCDLWSARGWYNYPKK